MQDGDASRARTPASRTVQDFGEQWTQFPEADGYYASPELFADIVSPLLEPSELAGTRVAEIGSGLAPVRTTLIGDGVRR